MFLRSLATFVVAYFVFLLFIMIYRVGLIGPKFTHNVRPGKCALFEEISQGAEDIEVSKDGIAFISSGFEMTSRFSSSPSEKKHSGAIYAVDMMSHDRHAHRLNLIGDLDLEQFAPHGLSLWQHSGKTFVFVVNHLLGGVDKVEKFVFERETMSLRLVKHFDSIFYYNLNDVAATGPDSFYFTNLNYFIRVPIFELYGNVKKGSLGYQTPSSSRLVLEDMVFPNGVLVSPCRRFLHMTTTIDGEFRTYSIHPKDMSLELIQREEMNLYLDNIGTVIPLVIEIPNNDNIVEGDDEFVGDVNNSNYTLLLSGHTSIWECIEYLKYPHDATSGSMVIKIHVDSVTGLFQKSDALVIFSDDGNRFSGCSIAVGYRGTLLVGSINSQMIQCQDNTIDTLN